MDDPELEISQIAPRPDSSPPPPQRRSSSTSTPRRWRLGLLAASVLVALAVLVSAWLPLHSGETSRAVASPTATTVLPPTPLPVMGRLGAPPRNCPASSALDMETVPPFGGFAGQVQLTGQAPVWISQGIFSAGFADLGPVSSGPNWPGIDIWWEIGPDQHPSVTVRAFALDSGQIAWWGEGNRSPTLPVLVMSPALDYPPSVTWTTYMTTLFITRAGCYALKVSWTGGGWYTIFAAGETG